MDSLDTNTPNRLLTMLSAADRGLLAPCLEAVRLRPRQILEVPHHPIGHAYFLESGLVSVVAEAGGNDRIEVGMVGYEGMTGLGTVLGADHAANESLVQVGGSALRISTSSLRTVLNRSKSITDSFLRYVHVFMLQGSQTALANGRGLLDERLARWLLMWHDRTGDGDLAVTHEFLALLLGVRRQGVTTALHILEGKHLIRSTRNALKVLDRHGLKLAANGFYGIPEAEYDRTIGMAQSRLGAAILASGIAAT